MIRAMISTQPREGAHAVARPTEPSLKGAAVLVVAKSMLCQAPETAPPLPRKGAVTHYRSWGAEEMAGEGCWSTSARELKAAAECGGQRLCHGALEEKTSVSHVNFAWHGA